MVGHPGRLASQSQVQAAYIRFQMDQNHNLFHLVHWKTNSILSQPDWPVTEAQGKKAHTNHRGLWEGEVPATTADKHVLH